MDSIIAGKVESTIIVQKLQKKSFEDTLTRYIVL